MLELEKWTQLEKIPISFSSIKGIYSIIVINIVLILIIFALYNAGSTIKQVIVILLGLLQIISVGLMYVVLIQMSSKDFFHILAESTREQESMTILEQLSDLINEKKEPKGSEPDLTISSFGKKYSAKKRYSLNQEMMSEHEFAINTLQLWGEKDTRLRLGIVGAFYRLSEKQRSFS